MLSSALTTFMEALTITFTKYPIEKRTLLDHFDFVSLALDEWIDLGILMESDPQTLVSRISKRPSDMSELSLSDPQSISDALTKAKDQLLSGVLMK
ncbi:Golgi-to-ER vesicle coat component [Coelomomyces lativittatus]|nr:Golgi-to-ER vesicle coat component [Coelomomyces lativittatus]